MIISPLIYLEDGAIAPPEPPPDAIWAAVDVPGGVYRYYLPGDTLPEVPAPPAPRNWVAFRLGMLGDAGFLRVVDYGRVIHQSSLASEINKNPPDEPSPGAIALIWNAIIAQLPQGAEPSAAELSIWNTLATTNNIPLAFAPGGWILEA